MRFLFPLALAASVAAQTPTNLLDIYSGCTDFTSRGVIGANAGEYMQQFPFTHFSGIGHDPSGVGTRLSGFQYVTQDQNGATQETYHIVLRSDSNGQPDCSPTPPGRLLHAGPLTLPPSTTNGPVAWLITATLSTVSLVMPQCATFYAGLDFPAAAGWTNDGQSIHLTDYLLGDNVAPSAPSMSWNCLAGAAQQPRFQETIRVGVLVEAAVLNMGNVDPTLNTTCLVGLNRRSFGAGGLWPICNASVPRTDGLDCRVRDLANAGGVFVLFLGSTAGLPCPGFGLGGLARGGLYLNPGGPFLQITSGSLNSTGQGISTAIPPGSSACAAAVNRFLDFQGFTVGPSFTLPGNLTNRASVNYRAN